jgi:hypothetical protein
MPAVKFRTKVLAGLVVGLTTTLAIAAYVTDWGFLWSEITRYEAMCLIPGGRGKCAFGLFMLPPMTYRVNVTRQTVTLRRLGQVRDLERCQVTSRQDWSCGNKKDEYRFGFRRGRYVMLDPETDSSKKLQSMTYSLTRRQYLWIKLRLELQPPKFPIRRYRGVPTIDEIYGLTPF